MDFNGNIEQQPKQMPLVSIIIPVYNGANYMREAIDSALAQTYSNIEVIVVNDGSTDNTEEIALSYGDKIRYFYKDNGGVSSALNLGIKEMCGEYFSWLSHDDKYEPNKVENQIKLISSYGKNTLALCSTWQIDKNSNLLQRKKIKDASQTRFLTWQEGLKSLILHGSFNGCAFLIPKSAFDKCGLFDESLRYSQDLLMWIKLFLNRYELVCSTGCDVLSRVHDKQLTQTGRSVFHKDCQYMGDVLISDLAESSTKEYNFLYYYAKFNAKYNNPQVVKQYITKGKEKKLIGLRKVLKFKLIMAYGRIRPLIRRIYYKIFKKVKTQ